MNAAVAAGYQAVEHGGVKPMAILKGVQHSEIGTRIQVQSGMPNGRQVHQHRITMRFVQGDGQINGYRSSAAASLGIKYCDNPSAVGIVGPLPPAHA